MRTITVTEKYRAVLEGSMAKSEFVRQMRQAYPMYVSPISDYKSTVQILKNRSLLFEEKKEVDDSFKYSTESLRRAIDIELEAAGLMSHETVSGEDQEKARVKAVANLKKDPLHYYHIIAGESSKVDKHDQPKETKRGKLEKDTFNDMKKATLKETKENLVEGTRALVGFLSGDRLTTTYNHYDGYPSNLGKGLEAHYNDDDKAKDVAMKGYITYLNPETGEIESTHKEAPGKLVLPDDPEQRAREIAEEIDKFGADFGYVWDDESNKWITIKNTGIRSMIDQIMDKMAMVNVHSGETMEGVDEIDTSLDPYEDKKEIIRQVVQLIKSNMPADNETIKDFIRTHYNDIINLGDDMAILDEFQEFLSVNTDYVDEAEPLDTTAAYDNDEDTQDMIDKMRKDGKDSEDFVDEKKVTEEEEENWREEYPEAKNSWEYDDQGYGALEAFFDDVIHKVGTDISLEDAKGLLDKRGEGGDDTKAFNQAVIYQMQATDDDDMDRKNTQNMIQAYEEKYNEPISSNLIKHLDSLVYEKKGKDHEEGYNTDPNLQMYIDDEEWEKEMGRSVKEKKGTDHDGDGDIDGDDYMAAKDKAIKKATGKNLNEALTVSGNSEEERKKNAEELLALAKKVGLDKAEIEYSDNGNVNGVELNDKVEDRNAGKTRKVSDLQDKQYQAAKAARPKDTKPSFKPKKLKKLTVGGKTYEKGDFDPNDDGRIESIEKYPNGYYIQGGIYSDYGDGDGPKEGYGYAIDLKGNEMDEEDLEGMYEGKKDIKESYRGVQDDVIEIIKDMAMNADGDEIEAAMELMEFIGEHYKIDFEFGRAGGGNYGRNDGAPYEGKVNKAVKNIIQKVLEEQLVNEAATQELAKIADEYDSFEGLKPAVISLENIVTEIESFYDKTRAKIQKIYNDLGEVRNEEGLKVGAFITPSIENAFKRDLRPITKNQFHGGLDMPKVKRISQADVDRGYVQQEAPKQTVYTPVNEKKQIQRKK